MMKLNFQTIVDRLVTVLLIMCAILFLLMCTKQLHAQNAPLTDDQWVEQVYYPATVMLYSQDSRGNMMFACTATAFEKTDGVLGTTYHFATAAHCVSTDDHQKDLPAVEKKFFYVTADEEGNKHFLKGKVIHVGMQSQGNDFAVLEVKTRDKFPTVSLGKDPASVVGEPIVSVEGPSGLGRQVFRGFISSPKIDRPISEGDIEWTGYMLMQLPGVHGGSSGSAVVCMKQRAICGFTIGMVDNVENAAVPASRFESFLTKETKDGH